jgi:ATP-dependent DNA helicase RecG
MQSGHVRHDCNYIARRYPARFRRVRRPDFRAVREWIDGIMILQSELLRLLAEGESDRIERTTSIGHTDKFSEAVTAFANDLPDHRLPGYLVIGVNDDGAPAGLEVTDRLLQNLGALRTDGNIQPLPSLNVAKFSLPGGDVAVVEVFPSDLPPVRYKGRVYIRVGPRKGIASQQDERTLTEKRIARTFDALPCLAVPWTRWPPTFSRLHI